MTAFTPTDPSTWPQMLTAEHVAVIYGRRVLGLKKSCQKRLFVPAPFRRHPYRWRKSDVVRDVRPAREQVSA